MDYYNAHGTGTKLNDMAEANAVRNVFGKCSDQPVINSTSASFGFGGHNAAIMIERYKE